MVIAHRGASAYAPENTLAAFDLALRMGAPHIELDVHLSADDQVVVIHDDTLDRTTNGTGPVSDHTLEALRALDAGSWFGPEFAGQRIPTLAETLDFCGKRAHLHIEIKGRGMDLVPRAVDLLSKRNMMRQATITSFQRMRLEQTSDCAPGLPRGWLVAEADDAVIAQAQAIGLTQICPKADSLTPERVNRLHAEGFIVRAWGVKTEEQMHGVIQTGADGMTVNFPDKLLACLKRGARLR